MRRARVMIIGLLTFVISLASPAWSQHTTKHAKPKSKPKTKTRRHRIQPQWRVNPEAVSTRPNIIMLLLDDQDDFTPFWDAMPVTSSMVRSGGMHFTRAFSPTPICTPARVSLLSGKLSHNTGVYTLIGPHGGANFAGKVNETFVVALDQLGYVNGLFGKTWGSTQSDPGWTRWVALGGDHLYDGYDYEVTEETRGGGAAFYVSQKYSTDFIADRAVGFLKALATNSAPFFVMLSPTAPHLPLAPAPRHMAYARRRWKGQLPIRANFKERDVSDKSKWLRSTAGVRAAAVPYARGEYYKRMGSLLAVDEMMGRVKDLLVSQGKWENTIVIVTSDNGYNLGSHRLIHKMAPYEESIRIPLYIAGPGIAQADIQRIVGLHDLGPTIVTLAGGEPPDFMDGKSLTSFLASGWDDAEPNWRAMIETSYDAGGVHPGYNPGGAMRAGYELDIPTYRSIRMDRQKYIRWNGTGEEELYDLDADPDELNNLVRKSPAVAAQHLPSMRSLLRIADDCRGGNCP